MGFFRNKKGDVSTAVKALVTIILAMTFLGLGIMFVRNIFKDVGDTAGTVQEQMRNQILEDLRTGDKKLSFPTTELKIGKQETKTVAIGIKNTGETQKSFTIKLSESGDTATTAAPIASKTDTSFGTFIWDTEAQPLGVNEANAYPIKFTSNTATGTHVIKITVESDNVVYATKSFFVTTK